MAYTWTPVADGVDKYLAVHINDLQTKKFDKDGGIACIGTIQWDKGADIASANNLLVLADGNYFDVTGAVTIQQITASQSQPGTVIKLHFDSALTIQHDGDNIVLPTGAHISVGAGDEVEFIEYTAGKWRMTNWEQGTVAATFDALTDTPANKTGHASKYVKVKGDESGLEYAAGSGGGSAFLEGMIIAWYGGYHTDGNNGGYTRVLGAGNDVASVNALLNGDGFYVCDGAALNLITSTIFNGANRYLPNLTDDRFLMGDAAAGGSGGSSTMAHTHAGPSHTHGPGSFAVGSHYHVAPVSMVASGNLVYVTEEWGFTSKVTDHTRFTCSSHVDKTSNTDNWMRTTSETPSFGGTSAADGTGNTGAASNSENRPKYLSCFYLMYVLA